MKLSEVKTSMTVALMKSVQLSSEKDSKSIQALAEIEQDITKQLNVVSKFLGNEFLEKCMTDAENCLANKEKFDRMMKNFQKVGARFSQDIEEG
tara:strand:+ start:540 stop:821 length:282 start_codon:yes stop_codon:yes gene_type:complete